MSVSHLPLQSSVPLTSRRGQVRRLLGLVGAPSDATVLVDVGLSDAAAVVAA